MKWVHMSLLIGLTAVICLIIPLSVYAELYQQENGVFISEEKYEALVIECSEFQILGYIDKSLDCTEHVLTNQGPVDLKNASDKINEVDSNDLSVIENSLNN